MSTTASASASGTVLVLVLVLKVTAPAPVSFSSLSSPDDFDSQTKSFLTYFFSSVFTAVLNYSTFPGSISQHLPPPWRMHAGNIRRLDTPCPSKTDTQ